MRIKSRTTSVIPFGECAICGKGLYNVNKIDSPIENVITKRNTVVKFHRVCYEELIRRQRKERDV